MTQPYIDPGYFEPGYFDEGFAKRYGRIVDIISDSRIIEIVGQSRIIEIIGMSRTIEIIAGGDSVYTWVASLDPSETKSYSVNWEDELAENGGEFLNTTPPTGRNFFEVPTELVGKLLIAGAAVDNSLKVVSVTFSIDPGSVDDPLIIGAWPILHNVGTDGGQIYQRTITLNIEEL